MGGESKFIMEVGTQGLLGINFNAGATDRDNFMIFFVAYIDTIHTLIRAWNIGDPTIDENINRLNRFLSIIFNNDPEYIRYIGQCKLIPAADLGYQVLFNPPLTAPFQFPIKHSRLILLSILYRLIYSSDRIGPQGEYVIDYDGDWSSHQEKGHRDTLSDIIKDILTNISLERYTRPYDHPLEQDDKEIIQPFILSQLPGNIQGQGQASSLLGLPKRRYKRRRTKEYKKKASKKASKKKASKKKTSKKKVSKKKKSEK